MVETDLLYSQQVGTGGQTGDLYSTGMKDQPFYTSQGGGLIGSSGGVGGQMYRDEGISYIQQNPQLEQAQWRSPSSSFVEQPQIYGSSSQRLSQPQQQIMRQPISHGDQFYRREEDYLGRRDDRDMYYQPSGIRQPQYQVQQQPLQQQQHLYGPTPTHQLGPFHPFKGTVPQTFRVFHQPYARNTYEERALEKMDGLVFLLNDQKSVLDLYDHHFVPCKDLKVKKDILNIMIRELSTFASLEEAILYPLLEEVMPDGRRIVERNYWEHMLNRIHLQKLLEMDPSDRMFVSSVDHMIPYVREHLRMEEQDIFPKAKQFFDDQQLASLFRILEYCKKIAPNTPRDNHSWLRGNILEAVDELRQSVLSKKRQGGMGGMGGMRDMGGQEGMGSMGGQGRQEGMGGGQFRSSSYDQTISRSSDSGSAQMR